MSLEVDHLDSILIIEARTVNLAKMITLMY